MPRRLAMSFLRGENHKGLVFGVVNKGKYMDIHFMLLLKLTFSPQEPLQVIFSFIPLPGLPYRSFPLKTEGGINNSEVKMSNFSELLENVRLDAKNV